MSAELIALLAPKPQPGARIQAICAGLPRTGTNSFILAISTLLGGPAYHAGMQYGTGTTDENHILTLIDAQRSMPFKSDAEKERVLRRLDNLLDGYVACADSGIAQLVPELMELYPDAKVVCTVRDRDSWAKSVVAIWKTANVSLGRFVFFWVPSARHFPDLLVAGQATWKRRYGVTELNYETASAMYDRHTQWLEEIVPKDKLLFYNVKDGWEPLCKAFDLPVPDAEYPRLNEAAHIDNHFKSIAIKGLLRWAMAFAVMIGTVGVTYLGLRGRIFNRS